MNRRTVLVPCFAAVIAASLLAWTRGPTGAEEKAKVKTIFITGGPVHDSKGCGDEVEKVLEATGRFEITRVHEDLSILEAPRLDPYELVIFHYTLGRLTDAQKNGLLNAVASGKGFAGWHSTADSFRECPEYRAMVGGHFVTHPRYREYQVSVVPDSSPIVQGLSEFKVTDEQYILDYDPRVTVLCSALWKGEASPVAWMKTWGKGRVFYLALGHDPKACRDEHFKRLFVRGAHWAATGQVAE